MLMARSGAAMIQAPAAILVRPSNAAVSHAMKTTSLRTALAAALLLALIPSACVQIAGLQDYKVAPEGSGGAGGQGGGEGGAGATGGATGTGGIGGSGGAGGAAPCAPNASVTCYTGPADTQGQGACISGMKTCNAQGTDYGPCVGEITPVAETCATPDDDDCDGSINEDGAGCGCTPKSSEACYSGPAGTENTSPCKAGMRTCNDLGTAFGPCTGEVVPQTEECSPAVDENCDGLPSCTGGYAWAQGYAGGISSTFDVAADAAGNIFATGLFDGTVDFGGGDVTSDGFDDVFVIKLDPAGNLLWVKPFGESLYQYGQSLATDSAGNVVIAGYFTGTVDFGGGVLTSAGGEDVFVAKLDPDGNHLWSKVYGNASDQDAHSVAVDAAGNVVITGAFSGAVDFGGGPLTSAGVDEDIFVAKLNGAGAHQWSKRFGDAVKQFGYGVAVDSGGDVFLTGTFSGAVDFGGGPLTSAGAADIFVAKLSAATGGYVWANRFGDSSEQTGLGLATDTAGNVVVTGYFKGTVNFGGAGLFAAGMEDDIFVAKLTGGGAHMWSKDFGDSVKQVGQAVAVDGADNVLLTGYFSGAVDFGGGPLTGVGGRDIYVVKLNDAGSQLWNKRFGDGSDQFGQTIAVDAAGNVILGGEISGQADFGGGPITVMSPSAFVTKLLP
jgi:hypothetical protein